MNPLYGVPRARATSRASLLVLALALGGPMVARAVEDAASAATTSHEQSRIAAERAAAEARFTATERECNRHFVVTSCVDEAKRERRRTLDALRERQLVVDAARRHERADERRKEVADKADEDAKRDAARAARSPGAASGPASASAPSPSTSHGPADATEGAVAASAPTGRVGVGKRPRDNVRDSMPKPHVQESAAVRQEHEATSRAAYDKRQAEASAHRQEAETRTARRVAAKPAAASLPIPAASAPAAMATSMPRSSAASTPRR